MDGTRPTTMEGSMTSKHPDRVQAFGRSPVAGGTRERTTDPDEAEEIISKHYLPNRLQLPRSTSLDMDLAGQQIGVITAGRLSFGHRVQQLTEEADNFHVNMPVRGRALSRCGHGDAVATAAGQFLVFSPEAPAEITWSADCVQLCLMIPRAGLEAELERLLGRSVRSDLRFEFGVAPVRAAGQLRMVLDLVSQELDQPTGLASSHVAGRHLEGLVLDGLLLGQPHNYSEGATGFSRTAPGGAIKRAVDLIEGRPDEPWTTVGLATEVHLSVRALQAGLQAPCRHGADGLPPNGSTAACPYRSQGSQPCRDHGPGSGGEPGSPAPGSIRGALSGRLRRDALGDTAPLTGTIMESAGSFGDAERSHAVSSIVPVAREAVAPVLLALGVGGGADRLVRLQAGAETAADGCC